MILAFSPEQAHEVAQAFDIASAVDASWWMNNDMIFPNQAKAKAGEQSNQQKTASTPADAKPAPKDSNENNKPKVTFAGRCPAMNGNPTFRPCRRFNQAARCQMKNTARVIEQRTPIHMHQETDDAAKMSLDVTGFAPEDISIHIEDYIVSIQGRRTNKLGDVFEVNRRFRLDKKTTIVDEVTAAFDEGILEITVPKKSIAGGPRKIPIVVSGSVADSHTQYEGVEEEESLVSSHEENSNDTDESVEEQCNDEEPQSTEDDKEENEKQEQDAITVETVPEESAAIEEDDDQQSHTNGIVPTKSTEEEETWEEVSN